MLSDYEICEWGCGSIVTGLEPRLWRCTAVWSVPDWKPVRHQSDPQRGWPIGGRWLWYKLTNDRQRAVKAEIFSTLLVGHTLQLTVRRENRLMFRQAVSIRCGWHFVFPLFLSLLMLANDSSFADGPYDRPSGDPHQSRSVVIATGGMVATSHPLAAAVGLDILKSGGNAVDAAIATNAMLGLVEPMSCGIGGDLFVIYWDAKTKTLHGLNASGRSPYAINRQVFADQQLDEIPVDGPLSWSVPGCVDGWFELHDKFGKQSIGGHLCSHRSITAATVFP